MVAIFCSSSTCQRGRDLEKIPIAFAIHSLDLLQKKGTKPIGFAIRSFDLSGVLACEGFGVTIYFSPF